MGQNLALNMADHGYTVAVYNRTTAKTHEFIDRSHREEPSADRLIGCDSLDSLVNSLSRPRKIVIMVKAGPGTDAVIEQLRPMLDRGDILVDGGNAQWTDTIRRERELQQNGIYLVGTGVSGGEVGARFGPSLMPGGDPDAWASLAPIWEAIAAKVDSDTGEPISGAAPGAPVTAGEPCTTHIGSDGAGHYVKMVHNGIEYLDMQLIGEAYHLLREMVGLDPAQISDTFRQWNEGELRSYLVEITADILRQPDPEDPDAFLVDKVLDTAGQKGTGRWTAINALELGVPANALAEAVFARAMSARKDARMEVADILNGPSHPSSPDQDSMIEAIHDALYCSKICAYAQGFEMMAEAQEAYGWHLDFSAIARIWRGGCIIRAQLLHEIAAAYEHNSDLRNLMCAPSFRDQFDQRQTEWREVVATAIKSGVPVPAFASALSYYDGYRTAVLPANLLQAQRDYFGAHTFERTDAPRGEFFHVDWPSEHRSIQRV
jgi:6-phosphogluconate dehydrogenase